MNLLKDLPESHQLRVGAESDGLAESRKYYFRTLLTSLHLRAHLKKTTVTRLWQNILSTNGTPRLYKWHNEPSTATPGRKEQNSPTLYNPLQVQTKSAVKRMINMVKSRRWLLDKSLIPSISTLNRFSVNLDESIINTPRDLIRLITHLELTDGQNVLFSPNILSQPRGNLYSDNKRDGMDFSKPPVVMTSKFGYSEPQREKKTGIDTLSLSTCLKNKSLLKALVSPIFVHISIVLIRNVTRYFETKRLNWRSWIGQLLPLNGHRFQEQKRSPKTSMNKHFEHHWNTA